MQETRLTRRFASGYRFARVRYFASGRCFASSLTMLVLGLITGPAGDGWLVRMASAADDFEPVAQILETHCVSCHSGDHPAGELSLDRPEFLQRTDLFDPSAPLQSELLRMITPVSGVAEMPKDRSPLNEAERGALQAWLESGAAWPEQRVLQRPRLADTQWWSLQPLTSPPIPPLPAQLAPLAANPIDAFILARLSEQGLSPSPVADRATLVRRLYFDLLGLPPTPQQTAAFLANRHPLAYEQLVDELLASPQYGERWARHWLDVVHFGETHGYDKDKPRPFAWPYRDYVIRRLNADLPYARFVREQLAGDVFWPDDPHALEATGFLAAGPWDFIGHAEVPESKIDGQVARNLDRDDMVTSAMNTFVSTTVQCARCHDHKFDPVSQEHYYSLQSIFAAIDRTEREYDVDPQVAEQRQGLRRQLQAIDAQLTSLRDQRAELLDKPLEAALASSATADHPYQGFHAAIATRSDDTKWVQIDLGVPQPIQGWLLFPCHDDFAGIGHGFGFPLRFKIEASDDPDFPSATRQVLLDATQDNFLNPGKIPVSHFLPQPVTARYVRLTATQLAPRQNDFILALAEWVLLGPQHANLSAGKPVTSLDQVDRSERWRPENLVDGHAYRLRLHDVDWPGIVGALQRRQAIDFANSPLGQSISSAMQAREHLQQRLTALPPLSRAYVGAIHHGSGAFMGTGAQGGKPRTIRVLLRGEVTQPGAVVSPGSLPIFPEEDWHFSLPAEHAEGARRQALAEWMVREDHPLTWRSIVNRLWQYHFGTGIVASANDFGRMGELPSHPELLDWLATEFRNHGQSWKHLHRLMVTSRTYQQVSSENPACAAIDSGNRYLWRMNRRALDAESIRDAMLSVSGSLDNQMYGPSFQDFVIDKPEHSPHYEYDQYDPLDHRTHRRAVYRFLVRSQPQPFMDTLDCADPSQSVARRQTTITALQALTLLNNRFVLTMAEYFSQRIAHESSDIDAQITEAFVLVTGRSPTSQEQSQLHDYAVQHGLANACRVLLNLNEFVFVD